MALAVCLGEHSPLGRGELVVGQRTGVVQRRQVLQLRDGIGYGRGRRRWRRPARGHVLDPGLAGPEKEEHRAQPPITR